MEDALANNSMIQWLTTVTPSGPNHDIWTISDKVIKYVYTVNLAIICCVFSLFGIVTNAVNINVFLRLGFQETINISLFGLAVSDMCSLVTLLWVSICYNPYFMYSDLPILTLELQHFTGGWTHVIFTRVTGFITAFITLERCLCITFPLNIKQIMTHRRVTIIIIGIYIFVICTMLQDYFVSYLDWKWVPNNNRTMLGLIYLDNSQSIEQATLYIQMVYPITSFSSVVVCTLIFIRKLNQRSKWLQTVSVGNDNKESTMRDQQIIKLVVCVAVIFIVSYIPSLCLFTVLSNMPDMNIGRKYENFFILVYSIALPMDAVNSSVNIFVYYKMMSKYKTVLQSLLSRNATPPEDFK